MAGTATGNPTEMLASLRRQWQGLQPGQRRTIGLSAGGLLAVVVVWASLAARGPAMSPLFTNLQPADAEAIVTQLGHDKVPYKLAANGQTILVPNALVDQERLAMAGQGLPSQGTVGLSSVLNLPFGATSFTRQVAYQNGLQGELEQTIDDIKGVASSRVQIAMAQPSTFGTPATPATSAVLVDLQPGTTLLPGQVTGIVNLVAASVQDLSPSAVTVIDQTGQILWPQGQSAATGGATGIAGQAQSDLSVQQQFDTQLQQSLQQLLDQVFGAGNVIAQVSGNLSFNSGTVQRHLFEPPGSSPAVVQSMQQLKQTVTGAPATGGVAGTSSNSQPVTTYPATSGTSGGSSTSNQLTEDFAVSSETQNTTVAPGSLSRLSVAVVVNSTLTPAQQQLIQSTVQAAVGYDPTRQDQITVVGMPFNTSLLSQLQKQPAPPRAATALPLPLLVGAGILALLLLAVLILLLIRRRAPDAGLADPAPALATNLARAVDPAAGDPLGLALQAAQADRDKLQGALRQRPEDVARVIRAWLSQDE